MFPCLIDTTKLNIDDYEEPFAAHVNKNSGVLGTFPSINYVWGTVIQFPAKGYRCQMSLSKEIMYYRTMENKVWGDWKRVCATSVEDVPKTAITFSDTTIYEPQITNFHNHYEVVDGECYVSLYIKAIAPTNQWTLINTSLPKPKRDEYKSLGVWENGTGNVICTIDQSGRLQLRFGTVGTIYIGTFRYKVAES